MRTAFCMRASFSVSMLQSGLGYMRVYTDRRSNDGTFESVVVSERVPTVCACVRACVRASESNNWLVLRCGRRSGRQAGNQAVRRAGCRACSQAAGCLLTVGRTVESPPIGAPVVCAHRACAQRIPRKPRDLVRRTLQCSGMTRADHIHHSHSPPRLVMILLYYYEYLIKQT